MKSSKNTKSVGVDDLISRMKKTQVATEEEELEDIMKFLKKTKTTTTPSVSKIQPQKTVSKKRQTDSSLQKLLDIAWKENSKNTSIDELSEKMKKI